MSERSELGRDDERPDGPGAGASATGERRTGGRGSRVLVPVVALLIGGLLGAAVMAWIDRSGQEAPQQAATPSAPASTTPGPPPGVRFEIPAACIQLADQSQDLGPVIERGVEAARNLDAAALSEIVRDFGDRQQTISNLARQCRARAGLPAVATTTG